MSVAFYYIIPIFILTIILLMYKTEFIYPLLLIVLLLFREEIDNTFAINIFGIGSLYFAEVFLWGSFVIFLFKMKGANFTNEEYKFIKILLYLYLSYLFFIIVSAIRVPLTLNFFIQNIRTFFPELAFFSAFCYVKIYGFKRLFTIIYLLFITFNIFSIASSIFTENMLHNAFLGFTSSYILVYTIYLYFQSKFSRLVMFLLFIFTGVSVSLPFLGSVRGGIISVTLTAILVTYYFAIIKHKISYIILLFPFVVLSALIAYNSFESDLFVSHMGSSSFFDLVANSLSDKRGALNYRDVLWETLMEKFEESPLFGAGYFEQIKYVNVYSTTLMAHNFFIYRLASGGIVQMIFVIVLYLNIFKKMFTADKSKYLNIMAIANILAVIVINLSNVHFASFAAGTLIWTVMGASTYILYSQKYD